MRERDGLDRVIAGIGTVAVLAALVIIWVARLGIPRDVYVSELGADGEPTAAWFERALLLIVAGGLAVAWSGRRIRTLVPVLRWWAPSVSLTVASILFLGASQVTCTAGCPVPQFGPSLSWQDLGHVTLATLAFAFAAWAMLQCAFAVGHRAIRRLSLAAAVSVAVVSATGGLMSVFDFYAWFGSRLEFVATTIGIAWVAVYGIALALAPDRAQQLVGEDDESADLGVVAVDPSALGFSGDRDEVIVPLPDDERALRP